MKNTAFIKLTKEESVSLLTEINPLLEGSSFDIATAVILAQDLPFYPGYRLLDIVDYDVMPQKHIFVLYKEGNIIVLDWSNEPLYKMGTQGALDLKEQNISDYIQFFFTYVRGPHGRFFIVNTVDDVAWREDPPLAARRAVSDMIEPIFVLGHESDDIYIVQACIVFQNSLFKSKVRVTNSGQVTLFDEELLIEDMPVLDDVFEL